jgi:hypothetical protein
VGELRLLNNRISDRNRTILCQLGVCDEPIPAADHLTLPGTEVSRHLATG